MKDNFNKLYYTLFHHNIDESNYFHYNSAELLSISGSDKDISFRKIAKGITEILKNKIGSLNDNDVSLTLTGGMDSRVLLAALLHMGIKPVTLTFGIKDAQDVQIAKVIANKMGLKHHNVSNTEPNKDWYYKWVKETIIDSNGKSHLHRAHRTAAISEHAAMFSPKLLITGHMGGEGIRGYLYNNYYSSDLFRQTNIERRDIEVSAKEVLKKYFFNDNYISEKLDVNYLKNLPFIKNSQRINEFFYLYDVIGQIHHAQDIRIYQEYVDSVLPVYLDSRYLELLFSSKYNFLEKRGNLFDRLKNPYLYCKMIEYFYPPLLDIPFANGFTPKEYLRGIFYYAPLKIIRDKKKKKVYPPSFTYGAWYVDFVKEHAENISDEIWEVYNKKEYMSFLYKGGHETNEGYWHKFSNPIFFDLQEKFLKKQL